MKKALLLIGATLATCSLAFAQMPLEVLQKSDNATLRWTLEGLPEGFTYVNRTNAGKEENIFIVGKNQEPGTHHAAAIELPQKTGQVLQRIVFFTLTEEERGKIFIASRPTSGKFATYTFEQVKSVDIQRRLNTIAFDSPVITEEGKVYVVGFEVKSLKKKPQDKDGLYPLTYISDPNSVKEANLVALSEPKTSLVTEPGKSIVFEDVSKGGFGSLCIVVQGDNLAGATEVTDEFALSVYAQKGRILTKSTNNGFVVYDMTGRIVATDSNSILPTGSYIVKARFGHLEQTSKVLVK